MTTNNIADTLKHIHQSLEASFMVLVDEGIDIDLITINTDIKPPHIYSVDGARKKTYMYVTFTLKYLHNGQPKKVSHTVEKKEEDNIHGELVAIKLWKMVEEEL
jgi:hypothetical protein